MKRAVFADASDVGISLFNSVLRKIELRQSWFISAERGIAIVSLALFVINLSLMIYGNVHLDCSTYRVEITIALGFLTMGLVYRLSGRSERIGTTLICLALFIFFSLCISTFNYLLLPLWREPIDLSLNAVDQLFGYHWPAIIEWAGQHPVFNEIVRFAYCSNTLQLAAVVTILGLSGCAKELHIFLAAIVLTAVFTVCFWGVFPSLGAKSLYDLPQAMEMLASPHVDTAYGDQLLLLAQRGPGTVGLEEIRRGLVAFPSYHIIKACIIIYSMFSIKWAFPVFLVLNALIFPGIYMHGGHHMVDLPAGVIVAIGGIYLARRLVSNQYKQNGFPEFLEK